MTYKFELPKKSIGKRQSKYLLHAIVGSIFALFIGVWKEGFIFNSTVIFSGIVIVILFIAYYLMTLKWCKVYIYEISCDDSALTIKYDEYNTPKNIVFNRDNLRINLKKIPVRSGKMFKLLVKDTNYHITQYTVDEWDEDKIKDVYNNLIKWLKLP